MKVERSAAKTRITNKKSEIASVERKLRKSFNYGKEGSFLPFLEKWLQSLNVKRQAYQGRTFVGNHELLKPPSITSLCGGIEKIAKEHPQVEARAVKVASTFSKVFYLFGNCHQGYNSSKYFEDRDIYQLETHIKEFLKLYRENFPNATILPKMHIMEDHIVPWIKKWRIGSGLMGEQGAESIHAHLMRLERTYQGIANPVDRHLYIFKEQALESDSTLVSLRPSPKKRKKESLN